MTQHFPQTDTEKRNPAPLDGFTYMSFDVVGTLIDFEGALREGLAGIAAKSGREIDAEAALEIYRKARKDPEAGLFPDDLGRCYGKIARQLDLPDTPENREHMIEAVGNATPFADSTIALATLARRYRLIAMTNARRWAFERYEAKLGKPFHAAFTTDDTGCEKPDPAFFAQVFAFVEGEGGSKDDIIHTAQSQHHDIGISRALGMTNVWIERRHAQAGYGGTIEPETFTRPDYHFLSMAELADVVETAFA